MPKTKYCTCEICPKLVGNDYCNYKEAEIIIPSKTWCKDGIAFIWMQHHKPKEVVDFLLKAEYA